MARRFKTKLMYPTDGSDIEYHGAAILLAVRERLARTWPSLCKAVGLNPNEFRSPHLGLKDAVEELVEADLLMSRDRFRGPYRLTDRGERIPHALGVSLTQTANLTYDCAIAARPFFGKPSRWDRAMHVFVAMPFSDDLKPIYDGPIKSACKSLRLSVERADDIFSVSGVMDDIRDAIYNAGVMVADCTGRNANVFYEIGIAHTMGKPVLLIAQDDADMPFDVYPIRHVKYSTTAAGLRRLERDLVETLKVAGKGVWSPAYDE